jgi:tetratricopeptide (TPR) repeat protein
MMRKPYRKRRIAAPAIALLCALTWSMAAQATNTPGLQMGCGDLTNGFGPFDYRNPTDRQNLGIVEKHHFNAHVESLARGLTGTVGGDIDYTLRAFPNHVRALAAMSKLSFRDKTPRPTGATYSVDCYFDRALRFRPKDGLVYMVYGDHVAKTGQIDKAIELMKYAAELEPFNATAIYNLGLMYFSKKDYDQALVQAQKAYELGFPLPGLKNKLAAIGKWSEMPARNTAPEASASEKPNDILQPVSAAK